jgi:hypothetical protein
MKDDNENLPRKDGCHRIEKNMGMRFSVYGIIGLERIWVLQDG